MTTEKGATPELETMAEAYRELLDRILRRGTAANGHQRDQHSVLEHGRPPAFGDAPERAELERSVTRDLTDAARYRHGTGKDLVDWLGFDVRLVEQAFWEAFSQAADQTLLTLHEIHLKAEATEYRTGETVGLGTLACDQCDERIHFAKAGRIPACPRCGGMRFHRPVEGPPLR